MEQLIGLLGYMPKNVISGQVHTPHFETAAGSELIEVDIPYKGNGYPTALLVYINGGIVELDDVAPTRSAMIACFSLVKKNTQVAPTYSENGVENQAVAVSVYKYSGSLSNSVATDNVSYGIRTAQEQMASPLANIMFQSNTKLCMTCVTNATQQKGGLLPDSVYSYHIVYSE